MYIFMIPIPKTIEKEFLENTVIIDAKIIPLYLFSHTAYDVLRKLEQNDSNFEYNIIFSVHEFNKWTELNELFDLNNDKYNLPTENNVEVELNCIKRQLNIESLSLKINLRKKKLLQRVHEILKKSGFNYFLIVDKENAIQLDDKICLTTKAVYIDTEKVNKIKPLNLPVFDLHT